MEEIMYLDTDCVLAIIKDEDWLKETVQDRIREEKELLTSMITILECRIVITRDNERSKSLCLLEKLAEFGIRMVPYDQEIERKSNDLMVKYSMLNIFDSLHIATAIVHDQAILSTDHLFPMIDEVECIDPRIN